MGTGVQGVQAYGGRLVRHYLRVVGWSRVVVVETIEEHCFVHGAWFELLLFKLDFDG